MGMPLMEDSHMISRQVGPKLENRDEGRQGRRRECEIGIASLRASMRAGVGGAAHLGSKHAQDAPRDD
jgi:hypothetical protein